MRSGRPYDNDWCSCGGGQHWLARAARQHGPVCKHLWPFGEFGLRTPQDASGRLRTPIGGLPPRGKKGG